MTDQGFRKALQELGAPDWYPQDAPRHPLSEASEQNEDGTWLSKYVCLICGWERRWDSDGIRTINRGDIWALHSGSTALEIIQIVQEDDTLEPFEDFLEELGDD